MLSVSLNKNFFLPVCVFGLFVLFLFVLGFLNPILVNDLMNAVECTVLSKVSV